MSGVAADRLGDKEEQGIYSQRTLRRLIVAEWRKLTWAKRSVMCIVQPTTSVWALLVTADAGRFEVLAWQTGFRQVTMMTNMLTRFNQWDVVAPLVAVQVQQRLPIRVGPFYQSSCGPWCRMLAVPTSALAHDASRAWPCASTWLRLGRCLILNPRRVMSWMSSGFQRSLEDTVGKVSGAPFGWFRQARGAPLFGVFWASHRTFPTVS